MSAVEIKVGQHWQEVDPRYKRPVVEVVAVGESVRQQVRSFSRSAKFEDIRTITIRNIETGRTTRAKDSRFSATAKRGSYMLVKDAA